MVRVSDENPSLANLGLEQFWRPECELAAAMRSFTQAIVEEHAGREDAGRKGMPLDIATEELSRREVIVTGDPRFSDL